tara:strand:+ start:347 stop:1000 length:654 start_codon:yes stop_codon:yes gene_type:complete
MTEKRLEKKFIFQIGDRYVDYFLINGFFKKIFETRIINSIYLDNFDLKNIWDNINGFSTRTKYRVRWYNDINNSKVFFEEKHKSNQITMKQKYELGIFKDENSLIKFLDSEQFIKDITYKYQCNLNKILKVSYKRSYFIEPQKKIRVTFDENIFVNKNYKRKNMGIWLENNILELKYKLKDSNFCNELVKNSKLNQRNKKYSKYIQSFIDINESGLV